MAVTEFGSSDPQTIQHWSRTTMREAISRTFFQSLIGTGPTACVQRLTELEKSAGDLIKYDLLYQMSQTGVEGDNPIAGFEEAMTYAQDSVSIDQRRIAHAFRRMSQQRTIHDLRGDARENLADRWAAIIDQILFAQLAGVTGDHTAPAALPAAVAAHGGNTLVDASADADHYLDYGDGASSEETLSLTHIERLLEKANDIDPLLRPAKNMFGTSYCLIVHPRCVYDLRTNTTAGQWQEVNKYAFMGKGTESPFMKYVVGVHADTTILASRYIPLLLAGAANDTATCLFLGAQAGVVAFGNAYPKVRQSSNGGGSFMSWAERSDDYGNEMGVAAGSVFGMKPAIFDSKRFGMIRLDVIADSHI